MAINVAQRSTTSRAQACVASREIPADSRQWPEVPVTAARQRWASSALPKPVISVCPPSKVRGGAVQMDQPARRAASSTTTKRLKSASRYRHHPQGD